MIRPGYWTDIDLHTRLSADVREFYVGLWMESDDAGYIAWDLDRIGADLYAFRPLAWRRKHLPVWAGLLAEKNHVRLLECGQHAVVPNLTKYQAPPKPSNQNQRAHDACLRHMAPRGTTGDQVAPAQGFSKGFSRGGKGREEVARKAQESSDFKDRVGPVPGVLT
jgi:hypothetical protein